MRWLIEIYRTQRAQVELDTDDYPDETAGWDTMSKAELSEAQEAAAFELVEWFEAEVDDEGMNWARIESEAP